jgi:hypothetical protein
MKQRVSLVTLGVADHAAARAFHGVGLSAEGSLIDPSGD